MCPETRAVVSRILLHVCAHTSVGVQATAATELQQSCNSCNRAAIALILVWVDRFLVQGGDLVKFDGTGCYR